ncbi:MAG TPA: hypothetical protein VMX74_09395 [Pirellulales bacterium]|nr:hypothetical protein [Pirellulales bacterium]
MSHRTTKIFIRSVIGSGMLLSAFATSYIVDANEPNNGPQMLLLRNGEVLRGHITLYGDNYLVTLPYGEIQIPISNVEHVCQTIVEGFRLKQSAIRFGSARQHYQLAEWCLDQGLIDSAREEQEIATSLQPDHPLAPGIQRRLKAAEGVPDIATVDEAVPPQPSRPAELDSMVQGMPPGSVESFTRSVQPLLINSCSARACHGSAAENNFQLLRYPHGRVPPRRITLRNLESVMNWVDREDPNSSRILQAASHPHGRSQTSSMLRKAGQEKLREWILLLAEPQEASQSSVSQSSVGQLGDPDQPAGIRVSRAPVDPTSLHNPADASEHPTAVEPPDRVQGPANPYRPRDPFDPEIFNRRYHAQ